MLVIKKDRENINGNLNLSEMEESIFRQRFNNEKFKLWQQPSRTKNVSIDIHSPFLSILIYFFLIENSYRHEEIVVFHSFLQVHFLQIVRPKAISTRKEKSTQLPKKTKIVTTMLRIMKSQCLAKKDTKNVR